MAESDFKDIVCVLITKYKNIYEVKSISWLGDDVVGMSIVYEAMTATQMEIDVLEIAYVSNMAEGLHNKSLTHSEVLDNGKKASVNVPKIIENIIR